MEDYEDEVIKIYNMFYKLNMMLEIIRESEYTGCFHSDFKEETFLENLIYILSNNYSVSPYLFYRREHEERLSLSELLGVKTDIVGLNRLIIMEKTSNHSGLEIGDIITKVNNHSPITIISFSGLKKLSLEILRYSAEKKKYVEEKKEINLNSINIEKGVNHLDKLKGYYKIVDFNRLSDLSEWMVQSPQSIVLDLRNNTGGKLEDAIDFLEFFIGANKPVCYIEKNHSLKQIQTKRDKRMGSTIKELTILTSEITASSAEIVISALKEYLEIVIIGNSERTYGKEYIQKYYTLDDETSFAIPMAKIYTLQKVPMDRYSIKIDYLMNDQEISHYLINKEVIN